MAIEGSHPHLCPRVPRPAGLMSAADWADKTKVSAFDLSGPKTWRRPGGSGFGLPAAGVILTLAVTVSSPGCDWRWSRTLPVLTSVAEIRKLGADEADRHYPVRLKAVTVFHDSYPNVLVIQDSSGGVRVELQDTHAQFHQGDVLFLRGVTARGPYFPWCATPSRQPLAKPRSRLPRG